MQAGAHTMPIANILRQTRWGVAGSALHHVALLDVGALLHQKLHAIQMTWAAALSSQWDWAVC